MWRPWTLRTPSLGFFITLCLCLLIANEVVRRGCAASGCHVFGESIAGSVPRASHFMYSLFPTALSVALSLLWILPHHDICRLEPYFRMSSKGGEKAGASLFLAYPYEISGFLPIRALYKGHYIVALSSVTLLVMNFIIVPFVANTFDFSVGDVEFTGNATRASIDIAGHGASASSTFSAYDYAWRQGQLAPFMMETYALLPVRMDGHTLVTRENWTVETTLFEAQLKCEDAPPPAIRYFNNTLQLNITSADGKYTVHACDAGALEQGRLPSPPINTNSCDIYSAFITPWSGMYWQIDNTPDPMVYMFAWASGLDSSPNISDNFTFPPPKNITAMFCTPSYYSETVNATISMPAGNILNITRTGSRTNLMALPDFDGILDGWVDPNISPDDGLLINASVPLPVRFGHPTQTTVTVGPDLITNFGQSKRPINSNWLQRSSSSTVFMPTTDSLASFALFGQTNETVSKLLDPRTLESTIERGLKILFAFAAAEILNKYNRTTQVTVKRQAQSLKIQVNPDWTLAARIALSVVVLFSALLLFLIRRRPCKLYGEPNSMAASLRLLSVSPDLCAALRYSEFYNPSELSKMMDRNDLFLKLDLDVVNSQGSTIRVMRGTGDSAVEVDSLELLPDPGDSPPAKTKKPWVMKISLGLLAYFPIFVALLIALFAISRANNGFPTPGDPNGISSKLLFTYIPLAAASAIEFILIDIGARQCMMGPYSALETMARYTKSLAADYDKCPPHFQLYTSVMNSEYTLAAISVAILLSNVLAVAIVGLFSPAHQVVRVPRSHKIHEIFPIPRQDMYFQMEKELTSNYSTNWTTAAFYIDPPFEVTPSGEGEYNTIGFGIETMCTLVPTDRITFPCSSQYGGHPLSYCKNPALWPADNFLAAENFLAVTDLCGNGINETQMISWTGSCTDQLLSCTDQIFPIWVQNMKFNVTWPGSPSGLNDYYNFVALNCSFTDNVVNLTAKVRDGQVVSLSSVSSLDKTDLASIYPADTRLDLNPLSRRFTDILNRGIEADHPVLQNHHLARINYLMAALDPTVVREPGNLNHVPNTQAALRAFEDVMKHLFVLLVKSSADDIFSDKLTPIRGYAAGDIPKFREHVDTTSFAVSLSIVLFSCGVILAVYARQKRTVAGHLPWSLGEMYSHLYASNVKDDMMMVREMNLEQIRKHNEELQRLYAYGQYPEGIHHGVYRVDMGVTNERYLADKKIPAVAERVLGMDDR